MNLGVSSQGSGSAQGARHLLSAQVWQWQTQQQTLWKGRRSSTGELAFTKVFCEKKFFPPLPWMCSTVTSEWSSASHLSLWVDFRLVFFLLPESGCGRFCILWENLQSFWKHKHGIRGPHLSLRNHIKKTASYWTRDHSQLEVWVLVGRLASRDGEGA